MRAPSQGGTVLSQGRIIVWNSIKIVQCIRASDMNKKSSPIHELCLLRGTF